MQTRTTRRLLSIALAAMLATGSIATAFASGGGGPASGDIDAGGAHVTETDAGSFTFPTTNLTATDTTAAMALATTIDDLRGTGAGWTLSMHMTQFTCSTSETCGTSTLPKTSTLSVAAVCVEGSTCQLPNSSATCSVSADTAVTDVTTSFTLCDVADYGTGMGSITVTPTLSIPIAADSYVGTYDSTVTIVIADGTLTAG